MQSVWRLGYRSPRALLDAALVNAKLSAALLGASVLASCAPPSQDAVINSYQLASPVQSPSGEGRLVEGLTSSDAALVRRPYERS